MATDGLRFTEIEHKFVVDPAFDLGAFRARVESLRLAEAFRGKTARKLYWALVVGVPKPPQGKIDLKLAKEAGPAGERVARDDEAGQRAITLFATADTAANRAAWLVMWPLTGRTHQLRVHCAAIGCPILGDRKYGGEEVSLAPVADSARRLHLHARRLTLPHPSGKGELRVEAEPPPHFRRTVEAFGFSTVGD